MDKTMRRDIEGAAVAEWFNGYLGRTPAPLFFLI
jgi:hypothetical protein